MAANGVNGTCKKTAHEHLNDNEPVDVRSAGGSFEIRVRFVENVLFFSLFLLLLHDHKDHNRN